MPPEPKKPIEELLEASAKARRNEFGVEPTMPNPMRARLHDEIAHVGREQERKTGSSWLSMWWPRITIGAAAAALVISASVMWVERSPQPGSQAMRLATHEAEPNKAFDKALAAPPALENFADKLSSNSDSLEIAKADEEKSLAMKKFAEVAIPPATPAMEEPITKGFVTGGKDIAQARSEITEHERARVAAKAEQVDQAPVSAAASSNLETKNAAAAPAAPAVAQNRKMETANFRQQFSQNVGSQAFRSNSKLKQTTNVLNNFQVEQDGRQIRVVDADGSTYTGKIVPLAQQNATRQPLQEKAGRSASQEKQQYAARSQRALVKSAADPESASSEFSFRATGYNSSLRKPLVFEGNYMATPPAQQKAPAAASSQSEEQLPARIVGTAKISGESPVEVDAVSVVP